MLSTMYRDSQFISSEQSIIIEDADSGVLVSWLRVTSETTAKAVRVLVVSATVSAISKDFFLGKELLLLIVFVTYTLSLNLVL